MKVIHHWVGVHVNAALVIEILEVIEPEEFLLPGRVQLTVCNVQQRPQRGTALASLLLLVLLVPRGRPHLLMIQLI